MEGNVTEGQEAPEQETKTPAPQVPAPGTQAENGEKQESAESRPPDTGLACLAMMARYLERPISRENVAHRQGKTAEIFSETDILQCAKELGLKARAVNSSVGKLAKTHLPAIAVMSDGTFVIAAKLSADGDQILVQDPRNPQPEALELKEFAENWTGRFILLTSRANIIGDGRKFDISWFIPAVIKYRKLFRDVLVASFFLQVFALTSPLFFQVIIDKVLVHRGLTSLDVLVFALIVVSLFEVLLGGLRTYIFSHTTNRIDVELGARLFKHLLHLPIAFFGARRVGETVARVRELENVRNFITGSALTLLVDLAFTFVFFGVMFYYAPLLTWIVVGSIPFYVGISLFVTPVLRKRTEEKFRRGAENQAFLVENVTGIETVKALAVEPQMTRRWEEQLAGYIKISFLTANLGNIASQSVQFVQKTTLALCLWYGAKLVIDGDLTVGQLVCFNMLSGRVSQPILRLAQLWQDFQQMRISIERLGDILNTKTEPAASPNRATLPAINGFVSFEGVTFRYRPDGPEILRRINLEVKAGQVIGIVGPSGSGKSTLTKLIQRLYIPESGRVMIDGVDLAQVDPAWLRRQVGVVLQENYLFNRSVRDNISLADPAMSMEAVVDAAKLAGAHEFILELSEGYDTVIGERGSTLSGGQRQRIAIARALVSNPNILIFDEATSALDYESEQIIQTNMRRICQGRTVFIIAHRLSTVRDCDRIVTVEAGEIVEDGSHNELLKTGGRYSKLWQCQMTGQPMDGNGDEKPVATDAPGSLLPSRGARKPGAPVPLAERGEDGKVIIRRPIELKGMMAAKKEPVPEAGE